MTILRYPGGGAPAAPPISKLSIFMSKTIRNVDEQMYWGPEWQKHADKKPYWKPSSHSKHYLNKGVDHTTQINAKLNGLDIEQAEDLILPVEKKTHRWDYL